MADSHKSILVQFGEHRRPLSIPANQNVEAANLKERVRTAFMDVIAEADFFLQLKDDEWGGEFVDLVGQEIPDHSILRVMICQQVCFNDHDSNSLQVTEILLSYKTTSNP